MSEAKLVAQKTGWLNREGTGTFRSWKRRFMVYATQAGRQPQLLMYKKEEEWNTAPTKPDMSLTIDSPQCAQLLDSKSKKNAFVVTSPSSRAPCVIAAETPEERTAWLDVLQGRATNQPPVAEVTASADKVGVADFDLMKTIGRGTFGRVIQVTFRRTGEIFAMKVLNKQQVVEHGEVQHTLAELHVLQSIRHPFLINLHWSFQTEDQLFFVLDYVNGGELFAHLQRERKFSLERSRFYAAEICLALSCLHQHGIAYRDLKPENLLLTDEGHIKLTDFGLAKEGLHKQHDKTDTFCGSKEYLAPEVLLGNGYGKNVDWWSFGSLLFEMLTGLPPFYSQDVQEMYRKIISETLAFPSSVPADAQDLISLFLTRDPERRLSDLETIKKHKFWAGLDWDLLYQKKITPPYIPLVRGKADTDQIDAAFTSEKPALDPEVQSDMPLQPEEQQDFENFTYVAGSATEQKGAKQPPGDDIPPPPPQVDFAPM